MVHLLVRKHNAEFVAYMDRFLPMWREVRDELNRLPFGHLDWGIEGGSKTGLENA